MLQLGDCQTEREIVQVLNMTNHQLHAAPAGGSVRRDVSLSGLDSGRTQMMGIIQLSGGGGFYAKCCWSG